MAMGWAVRRADGSVSSGMLKVEPPKPHREGMRWASLLNHLADLRQVAGGDIGRAYMEASGGWFPSRQTAFVHYGMLATIELWAYRSNVWITQVAPATLKKQIAGSGRADKAAVARAVCDRGFNPGTPDEADALALLLYAIEAEQIGLDEDDEAA